MKKIIYWVPALFWIAVIFFVSSVRVEFKGDDINLISKILLSIKDFLYGLRNKSRFFAIAAKNIDLIYHAFEYFILSALVYYAFSKTRECKLKENVLYVALLVLLIAVLDEIHQIFVPTRYCSFSDLVADAAGMTLMLLIIIAAAKCKWRSCAA